MAYQNDIFLDNLHRSFRFVCNNKTIKEGKLVLFNFNDFYYSFTLDVSGNKKQYKLPMAFSVTQSISSIRLDYTINALCSNMDEYIMPCKMIKPVLKSNIYNSVVEMVFV
jgi:hypothetical protein